uniref:Uncharacterized protein n=1 Tax=Oryza rufipogon TaxID=4529 RepID=A0A0E0NC14_ORYRU
MEAGGSGGRHGARWRDQRRWRRRARCDKEELPVGAVRSTTHEGWPAGGADAVVPCASRSLMVVEHRSASCGLAWFHVPAEV